MMATGGNHEPAFMETDRTAHYHERRFRALVEHSMDIIALVNTEGLVTYVSPSITPIMGYSQERMGVHSQDNSKARKRLPRSRC